MKIETLRKVLGELYGRSEYNHEGKTIKGILYGNDEMWDSDSFYQELLSDDNKLYRCYFEVPEGETDFGNLDYDNPVAIEDITEEKFGHCLEQDERLSELITYIYNWIGEKTYIATMIKLNRIKKNWSLRTLAEKMGHKSHSTVSAWEYGNYVPSIINIKQLAKVFEINYTDLIM